MRTTVDFCPVSSSSSDLCPAVCGNASHGCRACGPDQDLGSHVFFPGRRVLKALHSTRSSLVSQRQWPSTCSPHGVLKRDTLLFALLCQHADHQRCCGRVHDSFVAFRFVVRKNPCTIRESTNPLEYRDVVSSTVEVGLLVLQYCRKELSHTTARNPAPRERRKQSRQHPCLLFAQDSWFREPRTCPLAAEEKQRPRTKSIPGFPSAHPFCGWQVAKTPTDTNSCGFPTPPGESQRV